MIASQHILPIANVCAKIAKARVSLIYKVIHTMCFKGSGYFIIVTNALLLNIMDNTVTIKPVIIADHYAEIAQMMHELHKNEHRLFSKTANWQDIEAGYMRHIVQMQQECDGICLVAYANDAPAGFIFGYIEEPDDSRIEIYEGKELYVSDGYVGEQYRRQGIYHQLNEELEQSFTAMGVKRITRFTLVNNTGMRQLLEKEGYQITRLLYEKWL
jgi:ribosomal protein S18 acetylase RimI-like enzyme